MGWWVGGEAQENRAHHPPSAGVSYGCAAVRDASAIPCRRALGLGVECGVGTLRRHHPRRCPAGKKHPLPGNLFFSLLVGFGSNPGGAVSHLAHIKLLVVIWVGHLEHHTARRDTPCMVTYRETLRRAPGWGKVRTLFDSLCGGPGCWCGVLWGPWLRGTCARGNAGGAVVWNPLERGGLPSCCHCVLQHGFNVFQTFVQKKKDPKF